MSSVIQRLRRPQPRRFRLLSTLLPRQLLAPPPQVAVDLPASGCTVDPRLGRNQRGYIDLNDVKLGDTRKRLKSDQKIF